MSAAAVLWLLAALALQLLCAVAAGVAVRRRKRRRPKDWWPTVTPKEVRETDELLQMLAGKPIEPPQKGDREQRAARALGGAIERTGALGERPR